jgi:hypothetical protein
MPTSEKKNQVCVVMFLRALMKRCDKIRQFNDTLLMYTRPLNAIWSWSLFHFLWFSFQCMQNLNPWILQNKSLVTRLITHQSCRTCLSSPLMEPIACCLTTSMSRKFLELYKTEITGRPLKCRRLVIEVSSQTILSRSMSIYGRGFDWWLVLWPLILTTRNYK